MGDARYEKPFKRIAEGDDRAASIRATSDEDLVQALAHASREGDPYLANVIASELMNRIRRKDVILDNADEGMVSLDLAGRVLYVNPAAERILGWPRAALLGKPFDGLAHKHAPGSDCVLARTLEKRTAGASEDDVFLRADGLPLRVAYAATSVERDGELNGAVLVFRDITARKRAEEEVARWGRIFEHAGWGVAIGSADGSTIEQMNPAFASMHGWTVAELQGRPIATVFAPEVWQSIPLSIAQVHEKGHHTWESVHVRRDGSRFPVLIDVTAVRDEKGDVLYRIANVQDITERKRLEDKFRGVLEAAPDAMLLLGEGGVVTMANAQAVTLLGYARDEMVGRPVSALLPDAHAVHESGLTRARRKDGAVLPVEVGVSGLALEGETHAVVTVRDVTRRLALEAALREGEERFRRIFAEGPIGMALVTPDFRIAEANDALCRLLGYSREELRALTFLDFTHPADREADVALATRLFAGEIPSYRIEKRYVAKDGHVVWIALTASVFRDAAGAVTHGLAMVEDVTDRKVTHELLEESEARMRAILDNSPAAISIKDAQGRYLLVNQGFADRFRIHPDDAVGLTDDDLFPSALAEALRAHDEAVLETGEATTTEELVPQPGGPRTYLASKFALTGADARPDRVVTIATDISERKRAEDLAARERAALRLMESLASGTSRAATPEDALGVALEAVASTFRWPLAHAWVRAPDVGALVSAKVWYEAEPGRFRLMREATEASRQAPGVGLAGRALSTGATCVSTDLGRDPRAVRAAPARATGLRMCVAVPVLVDGRVEAVLEFFDFRSAAPEDDAARLLTQAAAQVGSALARLRDQGERRLVEERFRGCIESLPEGVAVLTPLRDGAGQVLDFRIEHANAAGRALLGPARERGVPVRLGEQIPADQQGRLLSALRSTLASGAPAELSLPRDDARQVGPLRLSIHRLQDRIVVRLREEADEAQDAAFRALGDALDEPVARFDAQKRCLYANAAARAAWRGLDAGRPAPPWDDALELALATGQPVERTVDSLVGRLDVRFVPEADATGWTSRVVALASPAGIPLRIE